MPTYKLIYFDVARQLLHLSDTPFDDERVAFSDWRKRKGSTPFGQLPVLEVDGWPIPTSLAINRFLAKQFGFAGKTPFEEALVDALADQWMDYFEEVKLFLLAANGILPGGATDAVKARAEAAIALHLPLFEKFVKEHGSYGYCVGSSLSWVDLLLTDHFRSLLKFFPDAMNGYPTLQGVSKMADGNAKLNEWRNAHNEPF